jgi:hypothetical protein
MSTQWVCVEGSSEIILIDKAISDIRWRDMSINASPIRLFQSQSYAHLWLVIKHVWGCY